MLQQGETKFFQIVDDLRYPVDNKRQVMNAVTILFQAVLPNTWSINRLDELKEYVLQSDISDPGATVGGFAAIKAMGILMGPSNGGTWRFDAEQIGVH